MKITKIKCYLVPPRWGFVKIETDEGLVGWGEPVVEGKAQTVMTAIEEYSDLLIGEDPLRINHIWQKLYRTNFYRGGPVLMTAMSGIDQALWDIKGKYHNCPVHELLGGRVRDKMKVYTWMGGDDPKASIEQISQAKEQGFTACKLNATGALKYIDSHDKIAETVERIGKIKTAAGESFGVAVDFHGRVHKTMAKILISELDSLNLMFIEEPVLPENLHCLKTIIQGAKTPIATGERLFSRWDYKDLLENGYVDIIQPDVSHCGGISETLRVANTAETYDVSLALHCPLGPLTLASSLQLDAVCYNAVIQEQSMGIHYNKGADILDYLHNPEVFQFNNGYLDIPKGSGLGVEINEQLVAKKSKEEPHRWRNPTWYYEDGAVAEW